MFTAGGVAVPAASPFCRRRRRSVLLPSVSGPPARPVVDPSFDPRGCGVCDTARPRALHMYIIQISPCGATPSAGDPPPIRGRRAARKRPPRNSPESPGTGAAAGRPVRSTAKNLSPYPLSPPTPIHPTQFPTFSNRAIWKTRIFTVSKPKAEEDKKNFISK